MAAFVSLTTLLLSLLSLLSLSSADDASVMSALSASLSPPPSDWSGATDHCRWSGVTCSGGHVTSINLVGKSLSGTLPPSLSSLSALETLALQENNLSGPIPSLSTLSSLSKLFLDRNNFISLPSNFFTGLTSLQSLSLSDNPSLSPWSLPPDLSQSSTLSDFSASNASLIGSIPDIFGSFANLQNLRLSYNNLTGSLPVSFAGSQITNLWLNNQVLGLSGNLNVLSSMTQLSQVWLHKNSFSGSIPDLSKCTNIFDLQLRDNQLTGVVPSSVMNLPKLVDISLANNKLQGPKPVFGSNVTVVLGTTNSFCRDSPGPCDPQVTALLSVAESLGYPDKIAQSWTGNDACASWTFVACNPEKKVIVVNFIKQGFSGTISPAFANLTSLQGLRLNDNNLTGPIPSSLTSLTQLTVIDLFNNNLTGVVPGFPTKVKVNLFPGNSFLGKDPAPGGGGSGSGSNSSKGSKDSPPGSKGSIGLIIGVVIAGVCFVAVLCFVSCKYYFNKCNFKKPHRNFGRVEESEMGSEVAKSNAVASVSNGHSASPSELRSQSSLDRREMPIFEGSNVAISIHILRQVTNNFSQDNVLGRGGFGVVYKGELQDGTQIAVKRMESGAMGTKGMKEFQSEIAVLRKVRHRHLVALLSSCANGSERLLVYEYMPQGTLSQHLFEWNENGYPPLTWKQRVTIALDVARGVEYLHSLARESFIHRDLKPSNILLGDDMRAKVADFGLVKNAPDGKYSLETRLAGTFGYLAPEYAATGRVTTKVDVYAYGVVLMEIITGRKALDESLPDERSHLVTWFRRVLINKDNLHKAIDQTLDPDEETYKSICKVAELAGHCTAREPIQRPDMGHAVNVLGPMVEQWTPSHAEDEENYGFDLQMSLPQIVQRWQSDEGTSGIFNDLSYGQSHASIPSQPASFADSFNTSDCR